MDDFTTPNPHLVGTHGDNVTHVLSEASGQGPGSIARLDTGGISGAQPGFFERFTPTAIAATFTHSSFENALALGAQGQINAQADVLERIAANPVDLRVLNQSQAFSPRSFFDQYAGQAADPVQGPQLRERLGLTATATELETRQALADTIDRALNTDLRVVEARQRLAEAGASLEQAGVNYFVGAGNGRGEIEALRAQGLRLSPTFDENLLAPPSATVVAASNGPSGSEGLAPFTTEATNLDLAIDGVQLEGLGGRTWIGTSAATPHLAGTAERLRDINPALTPDEVEGYLELVAQDSTASSSIEGRGVVDPQAVTSLAQRSLDPLQREQLRHEIDELRRNQPIR